MTVNISEFLRAAQTRATRIAVSVLATRGQSGGAMKAGRDFFCKLSLDRFAVNTAKEFRVRPDEATDELSGALPQRASKIVSVPILLTKSPR